MSGPAAPDLLAAFDWSALDTSSADVLSQAVARHGFAIVRSVFSPEEINTLREQVRTHLDRCGSRYSLGKTQPNAATVVPALHPVFSHPRVVALFRQLIGEDRTVFTGHCDIHMNMLSGWHRDSGEAFGGYFSGDYIADDACRVFKMAIYLQDALDSGGLSVVPGSHRERQYDSVNHIHLPTRAGDVVLFDVRLAHAGQLPDLIEKGIKGINLMLKGRSRTTEDARIAMALRATYWRLIRRRDRLSIFFTYGESNPRTQEFAVANMTRQNKQAALEEVALPQSLVTELGRKGVQVSVLQPLLPAGKVGLAISVTTPVCP